MVLIITPFLVNRAFNIPFATFVVTLAQSRHENYTIAITETYSQAHDFELVLIVTFTR